VNLSTRSGFRDVRATDAIQVSQAFCYKRFPRSRSIIHIGDQSPLREDGNVGTAIVANFSSGVPVKSVVFPISNSGNLVGAQFVMAYSVLARFRHA